MIAEFFKLFSFEHQGNCRRCGKAYTRADTDKARICQSCESEYNKLLDKWAREELKTPVRTWPCTSCNGRGKIKEYKCVECNGRGHNSVTLSWSAARTLVKRRILDTDWVQFVSVDGNYDIW